MAIVATVQVTNGDRVVTVNAADWHGQGGYYRAPEWRLVGDPVEEQTAPVPAGDDVPSEAPAESDESGVESVIAAVVDGNLGDARDAIAGVDDVEVLDLIENAERHLKNRKGVMAALAERREEIG